MLVAVGAAAPIGIPLGAAAAALPRLEQPVMAVVGLLQTVPSLALFAMLIPLLGRIGTVPALVALALYALLPIVRNTTTGLTQVPRGLRDAGTALGLTPWQRWRAVDLPLAAPVILAGVKTAAVITRRHRDDRRLHRRRRLRRAHRHRPGAERPRHAAGRRGAGGGAGAADAGAVRSWSSAG